MKSIPREARPLILGGVLGVAYFVGSLLFYITMVNTPKSAMHFVMEGAEKFVLGSAFMTLCLVALAVWGVCSAPALKLHRELHFTLYSAGAVWAALSVLLFFLPAVALVVCFGAIAGILIGVRPRVRRNSVLV